MKRLVKYLGFLALLVAAGVGLKLTVLKPKPVPVTLVRAERGQVEEIIVNTRAGTVKSRLRSELSPPVAGTIVELLVKKGDKVEKGQLLLRMDAEEQSAHEVRAAYGKTAFEAEARRMEVELEQAERDLARQKRLVNEGAIAAETVEKFENVRDARAAALQAAFSRTREAGASVAVTRETIEKTRLVAPFAGVIADVTGEIGEYLSPSPPGVHIPAIIDLFAPDSVYVSAPIDEVDMGRLGVGLVCRVRIDAYPDSPLKGVVARLSPYVEDQKSENRTIEVEVEVERSELVSSLLPGATADVEIITASRENVLRIPAYAVIEEKSVLVLRNGKLESVPVKTGLKNWEWVEILEGLKEGDAVVTSLDRVEVKAGAEAIEDRASGSRSTIAD